MPGIGGLGATAVLCLAGLHVIPVCAALSLLMLSALGYRVLKKSQEVMVNLHHDATEKRIVFLEAQAPNRAATQLRALGIRPVTLWAEHIQMARAQMEEALILVTARFAQIVICCLPRNFIADISRYFPVLGCRSSGMDHRVN